MKIIISCSPVLNTFGTYDSFWGGCDQISITKSLSVTPQMTESFRQTISSDQPQIRIVPATGTKICLIIL